MNTTDLTQALAEYENAYKLGKKDNKKMPVLDEILKEKGIKSVREVSLGQIQIPLEQMVGTKTLGRAGAFNGDFYPALNEKTEFANKWAQLYCAHMEEGIRDAVKAYEFMNKYYVEEGNKRVSVLKYVGAVSILANVTRIVPPLTDDKEVKIYYEYMDFYSLSGVNYVTFTKEGSYAQLQKFIGKGVREKWTEDERLNFNSTYTRFETEFYALGGKKLSVTLGDAFLYFISLYDYQKVQEMTTAEYKPLIAKMWKDFQLLETDSAVEIQLDPQAEEKKKKKNIVSRVLAVGESRVNAAFLYSRTPDDSGWGYIHELGRQYVQEKLDGRVKTMFYTNVDEKNAEEMIEKAIQDGNNVIFTTAPTMMKASMKCAMEHSDIKILNCSLNRPSKYVRTYYARMYEAKFLMGAIAGALTENNKVGYICDYPIFGMTASINAFALGVNMVNPRAKVYLEWTTLKDHNVSEEMNANDIRICSGKDTSVPNDTRSHFGVYVRDAEKPKVMAMPVWNFGKFYETILKNILDGSYKFDTTEIGNKGMNYLWGMSTGIVDVVYSKQLPDGTVRLVNLLKDTIARGDFNPFKGVLRSQNGIIQDDPERIMPIEELINMDWLAENIIGFIPKLDQLTDQAKPVVERVGIETKTKTETSVVL